MGNVIKGIKHFKISLQTMSAFLLHFLLLAVSIPIVVAMPELISQDGWEPPLSPPPTPPYQPMDDPRRSIYPVGDNVTEPLAGGLDAYCQMLLQGPFPVPLDQIPWFCLCTHCQSNQGPKGDRGDRGLPGKITHKGICI